MLPTASNSLTTLTKREYLAIVNEGATAPSGRLLVEDYIDFDQIKPRELPPVPTSFGEVVIGARSKLHSLNHSIYRLIATNAKLRHLGPNSAIYDCQLRDCDIDDPRYLRIFRNLRL